MNGTPDTYVHGHGEAVLRSHTSRTVANSAAYLEPHLAADVELLDVGCGPGTISLDFAGRVRHVTAMDPVADVLVAAEERRRRAGVENCVFEEGDVYAMAYGDDSFDIVHAHQVLQHLTDPVAALVEMKRVCRPGGLVAARDADYAGMIWAPATPLLDRWMELYQAITDHAGVEADAGRYLLGWAQQAGFDDIECSTSTWTFATPETRTWWAGVWADRVLQSSYHDQVIEHDLADEAELAAIAAAWRDWAATPDGWFCVVAGEVLCGG